MYKNGTKSVCQVSFSHRIHNLKHQGIYNLYCSLCTNINLLLRINRTVLYFLTATNRIFIQNSHLVNKICPVWNKKQEVGGESFFLRFLSLSEDGRDDAVAAEVIYLFTYYPQMFL